MQTSFESIENLVADTVAILGVPSDENSSFMRGPADAPAQIRQALHGGSSNWCAENGMDLGETSLLRDVGDLNLVGDKDVARHPVVKQIEHGVSELLDRDLRVLALGGDHAVTYPIVKAHAKIHGALNILHLDAHPDLYDQFEGNRLSHACPFARIMEEKLAARLVQVGIRTMNPHQREQAERFGVEIIEAQTWSRTQERPWSLLHFEGPVYLSLDLDVLDPAYAPGVSHHEPGGLSTRDVIEIISRLKRPLAGADIVELNPSRDIHSMTAMVAAKFLKEIAAQMLSVN